ncbi:polysaccharide lyase family 14 protein [Paxillus rubicundulus Ve08.2h10]|uniref:Polysaccharide lyase family 14 protein n=1 Tax=Paxillus rubicundulus Ve08.2h10 TaxID=930991 RepID=A0A0D0DKK3_9AGAM|nr:polysaccharide lyase family 14 protein [Paxillus rubicundulus Ve08.2h10]
MILPFCFLALVANGVLAAPAGSNTLQAQSTPSQVAGVTASLSPSAFNSLDSTLSSFRSVSSSISPSSTLLVTKVVTEFETTTVEVAPPSTTIVTVVTTATIAAKPTPAWANRTLWGAPPQMTDLTAFNVTSFPSGQKNVDIVAKIPPHALASTANIAQNSISLQNGTNQSSILQLVYPAHSVNPASKPAGGADFYAAPLDLTAARDVTLEYSVFFPADFDWVKGGKLPGLYGGHTGCSGGSSAKDCFSTRLMWRPNGVGELYLYAPKDKQSEALCADPQSVCDSSYGFSVGRGSFSFTAGDWTNLRQNVVLNTPGQQDGVFTLFVDGKAVINRTDMFYRDATQQAKQKPVTRTSQAPSRPPSPSPTSQDPLGGILGPLLSILKRQTGSPTQRPEIGPPTETVNEPEATFVTWSPVWKTVAARTLVGMVYPTAAPAATVIALDANEGTRQPAEFIGLFFSTFFGGHGEEYATPKDQYTWFKDFAIKRHA